MARESGSTVPDSTVTDSTVPDSTVPIGIIGIGLLGTAISDRLIDSGYSLIGFDLKPDRMAAFVQLGGTAASSPQAVFDCADRVFVALPTSNEVRTLLDSVRTSLRPGTIILDATTGSPEDSTSRYSELALLGVDYLDATIAGSSEQVRSKQSVAMIGGDPAALLACEDLLTVLFIHHFHLGPAGSGARMKLVVNLVLGLNRAVLAEGLALAKRSGIDPRVALEVLQAGPASSMVMSTKGFKMIDEDFSPQARLSQHHKDVLLILKLAKQNDAFVPLSQLHERLLQEAIELGLGDQDNSAVIQLFSRRGST